MLGMWGFVDFLIQFINKFIFLLFTHKYDKLIRYKYLLQFIGLTILLYYYAKEVRICVNAAADSVVMKLHFLFSYTLVNFLGIIFLPPNNHRANLRLELIIYNAIMLSYFLTYPITYYTLVMLIYDLALFVIFNLLLI